MIFRACIDFNGGEHPDEAWMIGDRSEDEAAACSAGISFMDADIWRERWRTGKYRV
jgi:phosphoglycolate phosphatase-like HAD superfamily hydrolase